jgi:hypothetical protein
VYVVRRSLKALVERSGLDAKVVAVRNHLELPSKPKRIIKKATYLSYPGEDLASSYRPGTLVEGFLRCLNLAGATGKPFLRPDRPKATALRAKYLRPVEQCQPTTQAARELSKSGSSPPRQPLVLLHAGPTWPVKEWPIEYWARLVEKLKSELGCIVLQLVAARNITVKNPACPVIAGVEPVNCEDDIAGLIDLVAAVDLLLCVDSGPLHVAGAVGTPAVALFGPTDPGFILSNPGLAVPVFQQLDCSFCHHRYPRLHWMSGCPYDIKCMKELTVENVFATVTGTLLPNEGSHLRPDPHFQLRKDT